MQRNKKIVCLTNIPTPYRNNLYRVMSYVCEQNSYKFEVWFLDKTESGRYWKLQDMDFEYSYKFFRGIKFKYRDASFHFNPGVIVELLKAPPEVILVGGSWIYPTVILTGFILKFNKNVRTIFWSESHLKSSVYLDKVSNKVRKRILNLFDEYAVPGVFSKEYVHHYVDNPIIHYFPNTVNYHIFSDKINKLKENNKIIRKKWNLSDNKKIFFISARLHPNKGLEPFFKALKHVDANEQFVFLVAGDGYLRHRIFEVTKRMPFEIKLLGHRDESEMLELYAIADIFVLPSIIDPNPLSVIEAMWAKKPLLLSNRVGNHPETLTEGENGWLFDPEKPIDVKKAFLKALATTEQDLAKLGENSYLKAKQYFDTEVVVRNFLNEILSL